MENNSKELNDFDQVQYSAEINQWRLIQYLFQIVIVKQNSGQYILKKDT